MHVHKVGPDQVADADRLIACVEFIELSSPYIARALLPFPVPVRTLDGLHLATMDFLRAKGVVVQLASYDVRLLQAADALGLDTRQP